MESKIEKFVINISLKYEVTDNMNKFFFTDESNVFMCYWLLSC